MWEYTVESIGIDYAGSSQEFDDLAGVGRDGWELVAVVYVAGRRLMLYYFKRHLRPPIIT